MGCGKSKHQDVAIGNAISKSKSAKSAVISNNNIKKNADLTTGNAAGKSPVEAVVPNSPTDQSPVKPVAVSGRIMEKSPFQGIISDDIPTQKTSPVVEVLVPNAKPEDSLVEAVESPVVVEETVVVSDTKPEESSPVVVEEAVVVSDTKPEESPVVVEEAVVVSDTQQEESSPVVVEEAVVSDTQPEESSPVVVEEAVVSDTQLEESSPVVVVEETAVSETKSEDVNENSSVVSDTTNETPVVITGEDEILEKIVEEEETLSDNTQTKKDNEEEEVEGENINIVKTDENELTVAAAEEEMPMNISSEDDANHKLVEKKETKEEETN